MIKNCIVALFLFSTSMSSKAQELKVRVFQDNKEVVAENDTYTLSKKTFAFQIESKGAEGFLVGATTDEDVYKSALGEADLEVAWFDNTGMAESLFNAEKRMFISNDAPSYWYFSSAKDHRMDPNPKGDATNWVGRRSIQGFDIIEEDRAISVKDLRKPLFLLFYAPTYDADYNLIDKKILFKAVLNWK